MKIRSTLAAVLLLSAFSHNTFTYNDDSLLQCDLDDFDCAEQRVIISNPDVSSDVTAYLAAFLLTQIPDRNFRWSDEIKTRGLKTILKSLVDTHITKGSLTYTISSTPQEKPLTIISNESALEVGYTIGKDIFSSQPGMTVIKNAGMTYLSEQVVRALIWVLNQTGVELLLPSTITKGTLYQMLRTELARCGVDHLVIAKILNK